MIHPTAKLLKIEIDNHKNNENTRISNLTFYEYSLCYYGLFTTGNRYCEKCLLRQEEMFNDFCELCNCCIKCCNNTPDCCKYK